MRGDTTSSVDLERAGIPDAAAAIICPSDSSNEADMRSILTVLAIETMAPNVRTVVEVNNPKHVEHVRRARTDEILVTSQLASRLLARTALYPGLAALVTDIGSGGEAPSSTASSCPTSTPTSTSTPSRRACGASTTPPCSRSSATATR